MVLVAEGLSNDEIAARLVISPATAKTHVSRAMVKLGARDRAQLVVYAYEAGLVRPGLAELSFGGLSISGADRRHHPDGGTGRPSDEGDHHGVRTAHLRRREGLGVVRRGREARRTTPGTRSS